MSECFFFSSIDAIIGSFFVGARTITNILSNLSKYAVDGGVGVSYNLHNLSYPGRIRIHTYEGDDGELIRFPIISLSHASFEYTDRQQFVSYMVRATEQQRYNFTTPEMPHLKGFMEAAGAEKVKIYYNFICMRIDLQFFGSGGSCIMIVRFEDVPDDRPDAKYGVKL